MDIELAIVGVFGLGGGELILVLGAVLIIIGARRGPRIFDRHTRSKVKWDQLPEDAGFSLRGIFGKPAGQVIAPENEVAELYKPAALGEPTPEPKHPLDLRRRPRQALLVLFALVSAASAAVAIMAFHGLLGLHFADAPESLLAIDLWIAATAVLSVYFLGRRLLNIPRDGK